MAAVADRAGVTRRAVYLHFASRAELVDSLFAYVAEAEGLEESLARVWEAPDAVAALDGYAAHLARYHVRVIAVDRAVESVQRVDEDAAAHRRRVSAAKLASCRRLSDRLAAEGRLAEPWTPETAADMIYALSTSDVVESLTSDRGWPRQEFAERLAVLLKSTFATATAGPRRRPGRAGSAATPRDPRVG
jgi:AcrR family transcriptional regulator